MSLTHHDPPPDDVTGSALFWLSVLRCARRGRDALIEGIARRRLATLGTRVVFDSEQPSSHATKEADRD
jgi:hypothetical protein